MIRQNANRGRVMVAKVGLDGHDRGARLLGRLLREEGFEVVLVGIRHTPEEVAKIAKEEEVDVVALSILSGAHVELSRAVRQALSDHGLSHVPIVVGGLIPASDGGVLRESGIAKVYHPGDGMINPQELASVLDDMVGRSRAAATGMAEAEQT